MSARPKRKKLIRVIIIISPRVQVALDNDQDGTVWEVMTNQFAALQPMMQEDDANWSGAQNTVWSEVEKIDAQIDTDPDDEHAFLQLSEDLQAAIDNL